MLELRSKERFSRPVEEKKSEKEVEERGLRFDGDSCVDGNWQVLT